MNAQEKLDLARSRVEEKTPLMGYILSRGTVDIKELSIPTAGTDGISTFFDPRFLAERDLSYIGGTITHEAAHIFLRHPQRIRGIIYRLKKTGHPIARDEYALHALLNIAADMEVNSLCEDMFRETRSGFRLIEGGIPGRKHGVMEVIFYGELLPRWEEHQDEPEDGESEDEPEDGESEDKATGGEDETGESEGEDGGSEDGESEDGESEDEPGGTSSLPGELQTLADKAEQQGGVSPAPDPDEAETAEERKAIEEALKELEEAVSGAENFGAMMERKGSIITGAGSTGAASREIRRLESTNGADWTARVRRYLSNGRNRAHTLYDRPSLYDMRSGLHRRGIMTGRLKWEGLDRLLIAIDVSGSMTSAILARIATTVEALVRECKPKEIYALYFSDIVHVEGPLSASAFTVNLRPPSTGGNEERPLWAALRDLDRGKRSLIVGFTDMGIMLQDSYKDLPDVLRLECGPIRAPFLWCVPPRVARMKTGDGWDWQAKAKESLQALGHEVIPALELADM